MPVGELADLLATNGMVGDLKDGAAGKSRPNFPKVRKFSRSREDL